MKKKFLFFTIFLLPVILTAQSGSGTESDPYYGSITTSVTWTTGRTVYVGTSTDPDLIIDNGGHLTIEPGVTVIFMQPGSDLIIQGTGRLTASGTVSSMIVFTRFYPTNNYWGHISFENMSSEAGASLINYCIIEYGDVSSSSLTPNNPKRFGGGIQANFSNLTISNCEIRNNKAGWGGGIFVNNGKNPYIVNCYIHHNYSINTGGGLYLWTDSYSNVENTIIVYNTAVSAGGGLFLGSQTKNAKIINSIISHNTVNSSSYGFGHNIMFWNNYNSSAKPQIINSIVWYPTNYGIAYYYSGGDGSAKSTDFNYCALENPPISYDNCFTLNSSNNNPLGPNFIDPEWPGVNWDLTFVSPCRDKGTSNGAPSTDYAGNPRIGPVDIGAYEIQYSRWAGGISGQETNWSVSGNWEEGLTPGSSSNTVIPDVTYDPVISSTVNLGYLETETGGNLTINPDGFLTVPKLLNKGTTIFEPGARGTISEIINNGTFRLESDATGIASLIVDSYSGNDAEVELFLTGGTGAGGGYRWHYISSPFNELSVTPFSSVTQDFARWVESFPTSQLKGAWVAYDGYIYESSETTNGFDKLEKGRGYNHYYSSDYTYTLTGQLNTSDVTIGIPCTDESQPNRYGYNLLGNPFSSGLDWDVITNDPLYPSNTSKVLHYQREGNHVYYINGVGSEEGVNGIIPPMQGFFTKTYSQGNSISLKTNARTHDNIPARYKGAGSLQFIRMKLASSGAYDNMVVRFDYEAKSGLDYDFDAVKAFLPDNKPYIYSVSDENKFAINGLPYPEESTEIPVVFKVTSTGIHTISATEIENLDVYNILLKDNVTGMSINLKTNPVYQFYSDAGTFSTRFVLVISNKTTPVEDIIYNNNQPFVIYKQYNTIIVIPQSAQWEGKQATLRIFDITGKLTRSLSAIECRTGSPVQISAPETEGIYFIEIRAGLLKYSGKFVNK